MKKREVGKYTEEEGKEKKGRKVRRGKKRK